MKNIITIIVNITLGVLILLIVISISGRMNRSSEIKSNLSSAVEETVENMALNPKYTIHNAEEYVADMTEQLSDLLDTDSDILVEIQKADTERAVLAVKVTETFSHPNGKEGTVSCERLAILNRLDEPQSGEFMVRFYLSKEDMNLGLGSYKTYHLQEGETIPIPAAPAKEGAAFSGWKDVNDYEADFSVPVEQDMIYYAAWN